MTREGAGVRGTREGAGVRGAREGAGVRGAREGAGVRGAREGAGVRGAREGATRCLACADCWGVNVLGFGFAALSAMAAMARFGSVEFYPHDARIMRSGRRRRSRECCRGGGCRCRCTRRCALGCALGCAGQCARRSRGRCGRRQPLHFPRSGNFNSRTRF